MNYTLIESNETSENIIEQIFLNRHFLQSDIEHYLHTSPQDILDPLLLDNMQQGVKILLSHLFNQDKIFLVVDSDCDGYTSSAILLNYLYKLYPGYVEKCISYKLHPGKEHGIVLDDIPEGVKLVIVPDAGSNDFDAHAVLAQQGIDVLVIDHHEADKISQDACIINNQLCDYPNKTLSGAGVVYKFCSYIDQVSGYNYADDFLDLASLGIIADVMSLREFETKEIINEGLLNIKNAFIAQMVENQAYSLKGEVTPFGVAFYIAPYVNAVIRMGTMEEKQLLFESMLDFKALELVPSTKRGHKGEEETRVEQACRTASNIKNRQAKARDSSLAIIEAAIEKDNLNQYPILIIQITEQIEENLTGLIANQIMGKYMKPVLIIKPFIQVDPSTGEVLSFMWRGSARNSTYSKLSNLREFLLNSNLTEYCSGHAGAFGISIPDENIEAFKQYIYTHLSVEDISSQYYVDFIWPASEIDKQKNNILKIAEYKSIWGQGIEEPKIAIENIHITKNNLVLMSADKNPTLKIICNDNISLIKFKSSKEEFEQLCPDSDLGCVIINIIGTCEKNEWNGIINPQIIVEDYQILSKSAYYF